MHFANYTKDKFFYCTSHLGNDQLLFCFQDGHEICFVGDEAFRELSQVDPKADQLLDEVS